MSAMKIIINFNNMLWGLCMFGEVFINWKFSHIFILLKIHKARGLEYQFNHKFSKSPHQYLISCKDKTKSCMRSDISPSLLFRSLMVHWQLVGYGKSVIAFTMPFSATVEAKLDARLPFYFPERVRKVIDIITWTFIFNHKNFVSKIIKK